MATYTSTQSGNFSAAATWGGSGPPADGDKFVVADGHTVTIDTGITQPTNGYDDSTINAGGTLINSTSGDTELRMNGKLNISGLLHLRDNNGTVKHTMRFKGDENAAHGINVKNTNTADVVMEGADPYAHTHLNGNHSESDAYLTVDDASKFHPGEWIAVFDVHYTSTDTSPDTMVNQFRDESFIIRSIDYTNNRIYVEQFVSPRLDTRNSTYPYNTYLFVPDHTNKTLSINGGLDKTSDFYKATQTWVRSLRPGQIISAGSASTESIPIFTARIKDIDYENCIITFHSSGDDHNWNLSTTTNYIPYNIYVTGIEKILADDSKVRKIAESIRAFSGSEIEIQRSTEATEQPYAVGDLIYIVRQFNDDDPADTQSIISDPIIYEVSAVDYSATYRSVLTLTTAFPTDFTAVNNVNNIFGSKYHLVTKVNRNITIKAATSGTDFPYFHSDSQTTTGTNTRQLILKDVHFKDFGESGNNDRAGFVIEGTSGTNRQGTDYTLTEADIPSHYQPWIEGISINYQRRRDRSGIWLRNFRYVKVRAAFVHNAYNSFHSTWADTQGFLHCISGFNQNHWALRVEGSRNYQEYAYNLINGSDYGINYNGGYYEGGFGFHDNVVNNVRYYPLFVNSGHNSGTDHFYKNIMLGGQRGIQTTGGTTIMYCYHEEGVVKQDGAGGLDNTTTQAGSLYDGNYWRGNWGGSAGCTSLLHNFQYDGITQYTYYGKRKWDKEENAWAARHSTYGDADAMYGHHIFIPAGTTVRISVDVKVPSTTAPAQYPYLAYLERTAGQISLDSGLSGLSLKNSKYDSTRLSSSSSNSLNNYYTLNSTIYARNYDREVKVGIGNYFNEDQLGYYHSDIRIIFDKPYDIPYFKCRNFDRAFGSRTHEIGINFNTNKKRLGGRIE